MCSSEERDKRIREMMLKKREKGVEKMNKVFEKIIVTPQLDDISYTSNSYKITDPLICPQITKGEEYIKSLSPDITDAIKKYTGSDYISINGDLRKGLKKDDSYFLISCIDKAFRHAPPLDNPITVYRGINSISGLRDDNGFSSCSLNKNTPTGFGGNVFTITIPAGSRILFIKPISLYQSEDEVLIDRCGMFRKLVIGKLIYVSQLDDD